VVKDVFQAHCNDTGQPLRRSFNNKPMNNVVDKCINCITRIRLTATLQRSAETKSNELFASPARASSWKKRPAFFWSDVVKGD